MVTNNPYLYGENLLDEEHSFFINKAKKLQGTVTWIKQSQYSYTEGTYYKENNSVVIYPSSNAGMCKASGNNMGYFVLLKNEGTGNQKRIWSPSHKETKEAGSELNACKLYLLQFIKANPVLHGSVYPWDESAQCCNKRFAKSCSNGMSLNHYREEQPDMPTHIFDKEGWLPDCFYVPYYLGAKATKDSIIDMKGNEHQNSHSFVGRITLENLVTRGSTLTNGFGSSLDSVKRISATLPLAKTSKESEKNMSTNKVRDNWRKIRKLQYWSE